jgi:Flp pilus assembly protein TadG
MRITTCNATPYQAGKAGAKLNRFRIRLLGRGRSEKGSSLVEFALVLPLLMLVATGIFAFGIALNNYLELTNAVTIGAQLLAVSRGNTSNPCQTATTAVYNAAPFLAEGKLSFNFTFTPSAGGTSTSFAGTSSECSATGSSGATAYMLQGEQVEVTATYPCTLVGYGFNLSSLGCTLTANVTEIIQ